MSLHNNDFPEQDWYLDRVAWFRRPSDEFGGFSNMAKAFPLTVFGMRIRSSEHLYQSMRFTHEPEIQRDVLTARTPMFSKRVSRERDAFTRSDWMDIRVNVMRWVLRVKLAQHIETLGALLKSTGKRPIVEWSRHDSFWGAGPVDQATNHGQNVLGCLLTELRDEYLADQAQAVTVQTPNFPQPCFLGTADGQRRAAFDHRRGSAAARPPTRASLWPCSESLPAEAVERRVHRPRYRPGDCTANLERSHPAHRINCQCERVTMSRRVAVLLKG